MMTRSRPPRRSTSRCTLTTAVPSGVLKRADSRQCWRGRPAGHASGYASVGGLRYINTTVLLEEDRVLRRGYRRIRYGRVGRSWRRLYRSFHADDPQPELAQRRDARVIALAVGQQHQHRPVDLKGARGFCRAAVLFNGCLGGFLDCIHGVDMYHVAAFVAIGVASGND